MERHGFVRILLATDGSEQSEAAARIAASFAHTPDATVRVVHIWNLEIHHRHGVWDVETRAEADRLISNAVSRLRGAGVDADGLVIRADRDHVGAAIAGAVRQFGADLLIIGSRGLSDWRSVFQHSISHELLAVVDCPVLVVRQTAAAISHTAKRVVLALAGGDDVEPGVRAATAAAWASGSRVLVVHVPLTIAGGYGVGYVEPHEEGRATVEKAAAMLATAGVLAETLVAEPGPVASTIAEAARKWHADIIVTGSSRLGDLASMFLGSVSHELLKGADQPILVTARAGA